MQSEFLNQFDTSTLTSNVTDQIVDQLSSLILVGIIVSAAITIPFLILYILSAIRKHKVQTAIFDIQKTLHEINDLQKSTQISVAEPAHQAVPVQPDTSSLT